ncbi:glycine betaine/proline transport system substrate-binding protein [Nocardiopsis mwathae]|uniref:Glycine betaine/proline transport system substrate-binding protein n=1 Tax=Nocardiopsis mwathae TaxID=1472723 RepID=A0A7X0D8J3_9ACTN|nr:glycine betaine ABC transporter substrate-binding protein [Nocardiopsis mwathae]MBB6174079.1 glycine betaine/proline transport system substrate-binding protein [Nocardiopsis mwathae]
MSNTMFGSAAAKIAAASAATLFASACGAATDTEDGSDTVRIALNGWDGYRASAAVVSHLLETELGYETELLEVDEQTAWQELASDDADVILENWGHEDLMELYGDAENQLVVDGGPTGNKGTLGWYMPQYVVDEYPGIDTVAGLKEHTEVFTPGGAAASGDTTGRLLGSDPTFVTQDQGMINHFDLDLEIEYVGSEEDQIAKVRKLYADEKPVLFYFYEPQWAFEELDLVKVKFPEYVSMCEIDPEDIGCDYPAYKLNKVFRKGFADENSPAYRLLDNWEWTNDDQNEVAKMIAEDGLSPEDAAAAWIEENPDTWKPWLPADA